MPSAGDPTMPVGRERSAAATACRRVSPRHRLLASLGVTSSDKLSSRLTRDVGPGTKSMSSAKFANTCLMHSIPWHVQYDKADPQHCSAVCFVFQRFILHTTYILHSTVF